MKKDAEGKISRFKARLVAQGFDQEKGLDFEETFAPVAKFVSIRCLIAFAVQNGWFIDQLDVKTAYLYGDLDFDIYMYQPEGFLKEGEEDLVCKLEKGLYGLKQSGRLWNEKLDQTLKDIGFIQNQADNCVYVLIAKETRKNMMFLIVYVDDILIIGEREREMKEIKNILKEKFEIKDLGKANFILGIEIKIDREKEIIKLSQKDYINNLLIKYGMTETKNKTTPLSTNAYLTEVEESDEQFKDIILYQSIIGSLMYLMLGTRPDLAFSVSLLSQYASKPLKKHYIQVLRILRYINGSKNLELIYRKRKIELNRSIVINGYVDSDWAGDKEDRKSFSGHCFFVDSCLVSWKSKKQRSVALSTTEAEYIGIAEAVQEMDFLKMLFSEMRLKLHFPITIFNDNQGAICLTKNPEWKKRSKHIDIRYHYVRERVKNGILSLKYLETNEMPSDIFTKGLCKEKHEKFRRMLNLEDHQMP